MKRFLFILLLLYGCSENKNIHQTYKVSNKALQDISLRKVDSFQIKTPDSVTIGSLKYRFVISPDGSRMAFADRLLKRVIITDRNGNMLRVYGKEGKGPIEFLSISTWAFDEKNNLLVYDARQSFIKIFEAEGALKSTISIQPDLQSNSLDMYARNSRIYRGIVESKFAPKERWKSKMMLVMDYNGRQQELMGAYDPYVKKAPHYVTALLVDIDFKSQKLYATHKNSYRIQVFNLETGERLAYFGFISPHYEILAEKINPFAGRETITSKLLNQSITSNLDITSRYILLHFIGLTKRHAETQNQKYLDKYLNIYSKKDHSFISEVKLPYYLGEVYDDKLFLVENNNPDHFTVGVYKLALNK